MTQTNEPAPQREAGHLSEPTDADGHEPFLVVEDLTVRFPTADGLVQAVSDLSYTVKQGQTLGIVGESGSGKSVSSLAVMGLHDAKRTQMSGSIRVGGTEVLGLPNDKMRRIRGREVAMIFQDPLTALHPFYKVGAQIAEAYQAHHDVSKAKARTKAIEMLDRVGIPQARTRVDDYPHQFSGGMRQRAMIAMALSNDPALLIADEPTTALDVTVQAQILDLLQELQKDFNSAVIIITHDLGVVAEMADDVMVMYAGRAVEYGSTRQILTHPEMPYTWGLLSSVADVTADPEARLIPIKGNPPSLLNPPSGCAFHPRCEHRDKVPGNLCTTTLPELTPAQHAEGGHVKRCHLPDPSSIYVQEVLPEIAPDLVEMTVNDDFPDETGTGLVEDSPSDEASPKER
jgi:peptide/nickel transport system ATP-binding protein